MTPAITELIRAAKAADDLVFKHSQGMHDNEFFVLLGNSIRELRLAVAACEQAGDGWIDCKTRMPEPDSYVLASDGTQVTELKWDSGKYLKTPKCKWEEISGRNAHMKPTVWQLLPPPPATGDVK